jgi:hypothetical protein
MQIMPNLLQKAPRATAIPNLENWRVLPQHWRPLHGTPPDIKAKVGTSEGNRDHMSWCWQSRENDGKES